MKFSVQHTITDSFSVSIRELLKAQDGRLLTRETPNFVDLGVYTTIVPKPLVPVPLPSAVDMLRARTYVVLPYAYIFSPADVGLSVSVRFLLRNQAEQQKSEELEKLSLSNPFFTVTNAGSASAPSAGPASIPFGNRVRYLDDNWGVDARLLAGVNPKNFMRLALQVALTAGFPVKEVKRMFAECVAEATGLPAPGAMPMFKSLKKQVRSKKIELPDELQSKRRKITLED